MANNYVTVQDKFKSRKFFLVRINPARDLSGQFTLVSGNVYKVDLEFEDVNKVEADGLAVTKVSTTTPGFNEFSYIANVLYINLGGSLSGLTIIAYYYLYFTDNVTTFAQIDPLTPSGEVRKWTPRLVSSPKLAITQKNVFFGVIEVSNDNLTFINTDNYFNKYFGPNDSWNNKEVVTWHCLDTIENIVPFYKGFVSSISLGKNISISVDNIFGQLNKTFDTVTLTANDQFFSYNPSYIGRTLPLIFQHISPFVYDISANPDVFRDSEITFVYNYSFQIESLREAINASYDDTNETWFCHTARSAGVYTDTVLDFTFSGFANIYIIEVSDPDIYYIGDNIELDDGGTNQVVYQVIEPPVAVAANEITVYQRHVVTGSSSFGNGDTITIPEVSFVYAYDPTEDGSGKSGGHLLALCYRRDYTFAATFVQGKLVTEITLQPNFESNFPVYSGYGGTLNNSYQIFYRARYSKASLNHSSVIQEILEDFTNIEIDTSTFNTAALTDITADFMYPSFENGSITSFRELLEPFLLNVLGMLSISENFEVKYFLANAPSTGKEITEDKYLKGSFNQKIEYMDIISKLLVKNPDGYIDLGGFNGGSGTYEVVSTKGLHEYNFDRASLLHEVSKQKTIRLMINLDDFESLILDKIESIYSERYFVTEFEIKVSNFDTEINDDLTLITDDLIGESGQTNITVIEINREREKVKLKGTDFLNI